MVFKIIGFQVTDQSPTGKTIQLPGSGPCFAIWRILLENRLAARPALHSPGGDLLNCSQFTFLKRRTGAGGGLLGVEVSAIFAAAWFLLAILNLSNLSAPRGLILVFISSMSLNPPLLFFFSTVTLLRSN